MFKKFFNGKYSVKKSKIIEKPAKVIFHEVCNLKSWVSWSPWLIHEPDIKINYSKNYTQKGGHYTWEGKSIGSGKITHTKITQPIEIEQKLEFYKPFRSQCKIFWDFQELEKNKTEISWLMKGKIPFLFRCLIPTLKKECEKDFEFGLAMLNGKINPKAEFPTIIFEEEPVYREEQKYLIQPFKGYLNQLPEKMSNAFGKMQKYIHKNNLKTNHQAACLYYKVNQKTNAVICDFAVPIEGNSKAGDFIFKTLPKKKYAKTTLKGNYPFLEMAWRQAFSHIKMKKKH